MFCNQRRFSNDIYTFAVNPTRRECKHFIRLMIVRLCRKNVTKPNVSNVPNCINAIINSFEKVFTIVKCCLILIIYVWMIFSCSSLAAAALGKTFVGVWDVSKFLHFCNKCWNKIILLELSDI